MLTDGLLMSRIDRLNVMTCYEAVTCACGPAVSLYKRMSFNEQIVKGVWCEPAHCRQNFNVNKRVNNNTIRQKAAQVSSPV